MDYADKLPPSPWYIFAPPPRYIFPPPLTNDEERIAAHLAKTMAMMCVRNTELENIHAGLTAVTRTGDYSDVMVIDADGREIPWPEVSHFDDDAMRELMRQVVNRLYSFQLLAGDPSFQKWMARWKTVARKWDEPELDAGFLKAVDRS